MSAAKVRGGTELTSNVISLELYRLMRDRKGLLPDPNAGPTLDERARRVTASIERINKLLAELKEGGPTKEPNP